MKKCRIVLFAVLSLTLVSFLISAFAIASEKELQSKPMKKYTHEYAVSVLCTANVPGTLQTTPSVVPGNYQTVVNIHNPSAHKEHLRKKVALSSSIISKFTLEKVGPDGVMRINCDNMREILLEGDVVNPIHGFEGFLVIQSYHDLDVTAIYSANPSGGGVSGIDVKLIPARKIR